MRFLFIKTTIAFYLCQYCIFVWIIQAQSHCVHDSNPYAVGQVWEARKTGSCMKCKCTKGNKVRCLDSCGTNSKFPLVGRLAAGGQSGHTHAQSNCVLDGKIHRDKASWIEQGAHSKSLSRDQCMECNCKVQVITCAIRRCPALTCQNPISQIGTCCKACPVRLIRPPRTPISRGCTSIGRLFQDKESWQLYLPSRNVFATCVDCSCQNGREFCKKHACPNTKCPKPVKRPGDCCALCPGERTLSSGSSKENHGIGSSASSGIFGFFLRRTKARGNQNKKDDQKSSKRDKQEVANLNINLKTTVNRKVCRFGKNSIYNHNELFNPILNSKVQQCTKCICLNSNVRCARIKCPVRYPCSNPTTRPGYCCKVCPGMNDKEARSVEAIQMYQSRGCSRAKKPHVQVYRYNDVTSSVQLSEKYLFDKSHQSSDQRSEIHLIKLQSAGVNVTRNYLGNADVMINSLDKNWHYLGAIKEKMFSRFLRHEKDLGRCRNTSKCIQRMTHLIEQLKTRAAKRRRCRSKSGSAVRSLQRLQ
eukprot:gene11070-12238_t